MLLRIEKNILINGVIISSGAGVLSLQGFLIAFIGEVFRISVMQSAVEGRLQGSCKRSSPEGSLGLVVNLYQNERMNLVIGALLLNPVLRVGEGAKVNGIIQKPNKKSLLYIEKIDKKCKLFRGDLVDQNFLKKIAVATLA